MDNLDNKIIIVTEQVCEDKIKELKIWLKKNAWVFKEENYE